MPVDLDRVLADPRRDERHLRRREEVVALEERARLLRERPPGALPGDRRRGRKEEPGEEARPHVGAVVGELRSQPRKVRLGGLGEHHELLDDLGPPKERRVDPLDRGRRGRRATTSAVSTAAATPGSSGTSPPMRCETTPIRRPVTPSWSASRHGSPATGVVDASSGSGPAIASRSSAQSSAVRASGPTVSYVHETGTTPRFGTRPVEGRMPVTPQNAAGIRIEPAVSVPRVPGTSPAATAAPLPPLEPPQIRSVSHGLRAGPKAALVVEAPKANSWVFSLPDDDRARPAEPSDDGRVGRRDVVGEHLRGGGRPRAGDVDHVLHRRAARRAAGRSARPARRPRRAPPRHAP